MLHCWYKATCKSSRQDCESGCIKFLEMKYLLENSGLPKSMQGPISIQHCEDDTEAYEFLYELHSDIKNYVQEGGNLILTSETPGNGKTTWAMKLLTKYLDRVWSGNLQHIRGIFVRVPEFVQRCKNAISVNDSDLAKYKQLLKMVDLVVWDDICIVPIKDFIYEILFDIIDSRCINRKANIYTSNMVNDSLKQQLGERLYSRIVTASDQVEFIGKDRRGE